MLVFVPVIPFVRLYRIRDLVQPSWADQLIAFSLRASRADVHVRCGCDKAECQDEKGSADPSVGRMLDYRLPCNRDVRCRRCHPQVHSISKKAIWRWRLGETLTTSRGEDDDDKMLRRQALQHAEACKGFNYK